MRDVLVILQNIKENKMNRNGKAIEKFLALRQVKRDAAANAAGKKKEDVVFKSLPASKRARRV